MHPRPLRCSFLAYHRYARSSRLADRGASPLSVRSDFGYRTPAAAVAPRLPPRPFLYPIVDVSVLGNRSVGSAVSALAAGGARIVQIRAKDAADRRFLELAREALSAARECGALLVVNDRPDSAKIVAADGVHLGDDDLPPAAARRLLGPNAIVGISTHDVEQLETAAVAPVDYVAVGPIYQTHTKARPDPVVGLDLVRQARQLLAVPLVAIGGITRESAAAIVAAGADGVAVISDLLREHDLREAARSFERALHRS